MGLRHGSGAKKAAHYSVTWLTAGLAAGLALAAAPKPEKPEADAKKAEAELQAVKSEIERVTRQVSESQVERDRLTRDLKSAELSVGHAREALGDLRRQRAGHAARRAQLAAEQREREAQLQKNRADLAGQIRAAYTIGRQEPLKLLLNQQDPALAGRMFVYYGYFGRARAGQIKLIEDDVQRLAEVAAELDAEDAELARLEEQQRAELNQLEHARQQRSTVLAGLEAESRTRAQNLERLRAQQAGLEQLLKELRAAMERFPLETNEAFAKQRGKLAWPVSGRLVARFGDARAGGVRWDGVLVATERGAPVRAVCGGRVIYADWLPGLGLLAIVDHGDGYLSLYGHNERLYKAAGENVAIGDTIAAAGDSGGTGRTELYFEIRKGGKPVDPRPWFRAADP
ncbi:MAG TPA: peptidoglycan DD-metalloendopeptidase family protein [Steroidobacteraceae bacterium]|nr:peptidoglycan DD-metalloendopeptidase family protein [Steroidobacteraceae bacterium]